MLPVLTVAVLLILSVTIRFVRKMKRITVQRYQQVPVPDRDTEIKIKAILFSEQLPAKDDENYLEVDCFGNLQEIWKHPI